MKKIISIIEIAWERQLAYRFTIAAYRAGEILEVFFLIVLWTILFKNQTVIGGYTLPEMLAYILVGNFISLATRNFTFNIVSHEIKDGRLSLFLVKPISYLQYVFTRELGRVMLPTAISLISQGVVILFFLDRIFLNTSLVAVFLVITMTVFAFILEFLQEFLVSLITFWTDEVDGLYATIQRIKKFVSGGYFPLSLLPPAYITASYALPFAYSFFVPTQVYLGRLSTVHAFFGLAIQLGWVLILFVLIQSVWRRGIRRYEGVGI